MVISNYRIFKIKIYIFLVRVLIDKGGGGEGGGGKVKEFVLIGQNLLSMMLLVMDPLVTGCFY